MKKKKIRLHPALVFLILTIAIMIISCVGSIFSLEANYYVVNEIINITQKHDDVSFCLYFSDHGEDIYDSTETKILGHSELANEPMTTIPFVLWTSEKYRSIRKKIIYNLYQNQKKSYNSEHVIHTVIRLAGLDNQDIEKEKSLAD